MKMLLLGCIKIDKDYKIGQSIVFSSYIYLSNRFNRFDGWDWWFLKGWQFQ